ncbi:NAD(P)-dependent dehydrogenase (short-subunit alcohol dehydrogenase family) [Algoriphagus boseongensis]|uniref:NAD(P)-dependent dehydrogenase (Short-subunit alcohol dehydrogenase family) n=1 Tax=Algoriphagus boseongensis TaxID=1442587 RepID=A0A4R6T8F8_9BACT|nr:SDR family oxidoreductase [Algoriphagus boseongensis]TDQ18443.1 NAD(P)-dependent dehydrogenase (short-subunit alcohol dehydrogenase family) [Algoriphagus boseongensis]
MKHKTVLITGGASGIGLAMVKKFAAEGSQVYFIDTNHIEGTKVQMEEHEKGLSVKFLEGNLSDEENVRHLVHSIPSKLDVLINNAGISHIGKVENTTGEDFDRLYSVNIKGVFHAIKAALPKLLEKGGGSILNLCSVAATIGIPDRFAYSMTKGAVLSMTLSIARDYVDQGIRCNCISPGRVHTPFVDGFLAKNYPGQEKEMFAKLAATQPLGRMGTPEEIAELAYFISSDAGSFITGANYTIDGGFMGLKM